MILLDYPISKRRIAEEMGEMMRPAMELPPIIGRISKSSSKKEFWLRKGLDFKKIFEPSRGGTGRRLNRARLTLRPTKKVRTSETNDVPVRWKIREKITARIILAAGPAKPMMAVSRWGFLRLYGSNGEDFPQPKAPVKIIIRVPTGSEWARGFKVTRPRDLGVGSPR